MNNIEFTLLLWGGSFDAGLLGALTGARVLVAAKTKALRLVFSIVIFALGVEMIVNGITGRL